MSRRQTTLKRTGITSDDSAPDANIAGVQPDGLDEVAFYLTAASESDTCTVRIWYWRSGSWHKGADTQDLTGSTVVMGYTLTVPCWLQLVDVVGTWAVRADLVEKSA